MTQVLGDVGGGRGLTYVLRDSACHHASPRPLGYPPLPFDQPSPLVVGCLLRCPPAADQHWVSDYY